MRLLWVPLLLTPLLCRAQEPPVAAPAATQTPAASAQVVQPAVVPGILTGTVTDERGALVPGATVILTAEGVEENRQVVTDAEGGFEFQAVLPGSFRLAATAVGLQPGSATGALKPGERQELPPITLRVGLQNTEVEVTFTREELGVAEVQAEEKQRLLGIIPNFSVAYDWDAPPMTTRQKYEVVWKEAIDPVSIVLVAGAAGYELATQEYYYPHKADPGWTLGAAGYFKRFGADMATATFGSFLAGAALPQVFHQDPRYFWMGSGTVRQRIKYSLSTVFICRNDRNGKWMPNYSNVIGDFTAGAVSNLYYPASSRQGVALTFENGAEALGLGAIGNLFQEFLLHKFTPRLPRSNPAPVASPLP